MGSRLLALALLLVGCGPRLPQPGSPADRPPAGEVARVDADSALARFLESLGSSGPTGPIVRPCLEQHGELGARSRCAMERLGKAMDRSGRCDVAEAFLVPRMVARHFACVPHSVSEEREVFGAVLSFLDGGGRFIGRACPRERDALGFTADVGGVLGIVELYLGDASATRAVARSWGARVVPTTTADLRQVCANTGA